MEKIKVLIVTDSAYLSTGYGSVMFNLLKRWTKHKEFEFYHVGNSAERVHKHQIGEGFYYALPRFDDFAYQTLPFYIKKYSPDIVLTLYDIGYQSGFTQIIQKAHQDGWRGNWITYVPVDTNFPAWTWKNVFNSFENVVAMSEHGKNFIKREFDIDAKMIPHGVNREVFKPLDKNEMKRKAGFSPNDFVIGAVGKNQIRKMWTVLLKAYEEFSKNKEDVKLLLHTETTPKDVNSGWDFNYLSKKHKIIIKSTLKEINFIQRQFIEEEQLNKIYNTMDLYAFSTGGEGFGIPTLEALSAGVPVTVTEYTTGKELCKDAGFKTIPTLLDKYNREVKWVGMNGVEFAIGDDKVLKENLEYYYNIWKNHKKDYEKFQKQAVKHAEKYDYDKIAELWIDYFKQTHEN